METRELKAQGKGEVDYDYKNDILFFKVKNRQYQKSLDFEDLVVDIDKEGYITGIQIMDASSLFGLAKDALLKVRKWEFNAKIENNVVTIKLAFEVLRRNKVLVKQNIERESTAPLRDSEVLCTVTA
jgi:uncharacterized protein YuzE